MEVKREKIVAALHAGTPIPNIIKALKTSRATIFRVKKCLKTSGQVKRKSGSERKLTVVSSKLIGAIRS